MIMHRRVASFIFVCAVITASLVRGQDRAADTIPQAIYKYVARPEKSYHWEIVNKIKLDQGQVYDVDLTSQEWQGITWKHVLQLFEPAKVKYPEHVLLFINGGSTGKRPGQEGIASGLKLAELTGARVAFLYQVPNQPLFDGRVEDDLITETWLRYLETGDETWPLLFPMVKSAVKAMDAVTEIAKQEWNQPVAGFVITGGSKRGWTSWLTPVADKRIIATAPIVIDVLNFRAQMKHQLETWGKYSEQIEDYTSKGLVKTGDESPREAMLRQMMDPYTYRSQLSLPKLLINGANDRYWTVDATQFYWSDLVGPKYFLAIPNAGHGLDGGRELAFSTLGVFFRHVASGKPMPEINWEHVNGEGELVLNVKSSRSPQSARLWVAKSDDKDFRDDKWNPQPFHRDQGSYVGKVAKPNHGHVALFGELQFLHEGISFSLCTLVRAE